MLHRLFIYVLFLSIFMTKVHDGLFYSKTYAFQAQIFIKGLLVCVKCDYFVFWCFHALPLYNCHNQTYAYCTHFKMRSYLTDDVLVCETDDQSVLGGVVLIFFLNNKSFAGIVVCPALWNNFDKCNCNDSLIDYSVNKVVSELIPNYVFHSISLHWVSVFPPFLP